MPTEKQGEYDYSLGIEPNPEGGQAYCRGYYGKYTGVGGWIRGEQCADQGNPLPDVASDDFRRGYEFRKNMNEMRQKDAF